MTPRSQLLSSALLTGMLLAAPQAEARFGKSSQSAESTQEEKKDSGSSTHDATPVRDSSSTHDATPVSEYSRPTSSSNDSPHEAVPAERSHRDSRRQERYYPPRSYYVEPSVPLAYDEPAVSENSEEYRRAKNFVFGFDLQVLPGGRGAGLHMGFELERWGAMVRASELTLDADDGSGAEDAIRLMQAHVSWAVLKSQHGRVRLEGGLSIAKAPDITFVGPSLGASAELYLGRSVSFEARVHVTPVPYRQVDTAGGLVVYFFEDVFALRGGVRMILLNDAGKVDGVVHEDILPGPYFSLGLAI